MPLSNALTLNYAAVADDDVDDVDDVVDGMSGVRVEVGRGGHDCCYYC